MRDSFQTILNTLMKIGYKKQHIVDREYIKHFVAFYYFCKRKNLPRV